jgi:hypothetical protein
LDYFAEYSPQIPFQGRVPVLVQKLVEQGDGEQFP